MGVRGATPLQRFCLFLSVCDSQDILNNLHSPGVEEVDDDDIMLDVDLPEDGLHGELTHLVVLEQKNIQPSQWQKKVYSLSISSNMLPRLIAGGSNPRSAVQHLLEWSRRLL